MSFRRLKTVACGVAVWLGAGGALAAAAEATPDPVRVQLRITRENGPENVRYGFFNDVTGERVARLRVGRITLAYGKQGAFRVAWKPKAVLQDVELQITDAAAWPAVSSKLADTLGSLAQKGNLVMQDVVIERAGEPAQRAEAPTAELTKAGDLVLPAARLTPGAPPVRLTLTLRGPHAGDISQQPLDSSTAAAGPAAAVFDGAKSP